MNRHAGYRVDKSPVQLEITGIDDDFIAPPTLAEGNPIEEVYRSATMNRREKIKDMQNFHFHYYTRRKLPLTGAGLNRINEEEY